MRLIEDSGIRSFEKHCLGSLLDGRCIMADPQEYQDAREDVAVWMRYHFEREQLSLIALAIVDALSDQVGR